MANHINRDGKRSINLVGQKFFRLLVIREWEVPDPGEVYWLCECDCGEAKIATTSKLRRGMVKSRGCLRRKFDPSDTRVRHGKSSTPEYFAWSRMRQRCTDSSLVGSHNYIGRGIKVCDRWMHSFENFYLDMGPKPSGQRISVERINNDGDYEPGNCKWATPQEQGKNTRTVKVVEWRGRKMILKDWANELGVNYQTAKWRLKKGWPLDLVFSGKRYTRWSKPIVEAQAGGQCSG